jgi:hypothetical protein
MHFVNDTEIADYKSRNPRQIADSVLDDHAQDLSMAIAFLFVDCGYLIGL